MQYDNDESMAAAIRLVRDNPKLRDLGHVAVRSKTIGQISLADAFLSDPRHLVTATSAIIEGAKNNNVSEELISQLETILEKFKTGAEKLGNFDYTLKILAGMQGLKERSELEPVLERALANAPDEGNREQIRNLLDNVRGPAGIDLIEMAAPSRLAVSCDWGCCAFTCVLCWSGCLVCCAAACLLCFTSTIPVFI